jgi:hypothetical protein
MKNEQKEVADIFRLYGKAYRQGNVVSCEQRKVMRHIEQCRTAALGGHVERCNACSFERIAYNSCRNRHCPKCQAMAKEQWLNNRKAELLPCGYFHLVFTLPHGLNPIILNNRKQTLALLFSTVNETLQVFARDPQWRLEGQLGFIGVLHTWSQTLIDHFHLHCLIPGGVLDRDRWLPARDSYLFKVESLAREFKKRYLKKLTRVYRQDKINVPEKPPIDDILRSLAERQWIVYAKRPFAGPQQVLEYLGRYTHRVAISNHRILSVAQGKVVFTYRDPGRKAVRIMTLAAEEFIRRFLLHVLPKGFMKIRYFGFLAHRNKKQLIPLLRKLINPTAKLPEKIKETVAQMVLRLTGIELTLCPECKKGRMVKVRDLPKIYQNTS